MIRPPLKRSIRQLAMIAAAAAVGCGTPVPEVPVASAVSYAEHLEPLVIAHCLACHESEDPKGKLVLDHGEGYGQLVGRRSTQVPELDLVAPGDLEGSYLWHKIEHRSREGKGMPRTLTGVKKLRPAEVDLYRRWIEGGALP